MPHELPTKLKLILLGNEEITKYYENLNFGQRYSLVSSLPSRNKTLAIAVKKYAKADIKVFYFCQI